MSRFAVIAAVFLGVAAVGGSSVVSADEASQPQVTPKLAKTFKAAQDALQAKNYTEALAKLKELQASQGRSGYDDFVINAWLVQVYSAQGDTANLVAAAEAEAASSYVSAESRISIYKSLASNSFNAKNYDRAIEFAQKSKAAGDSSAETDQLIGQAYFVGNKFKEATAVFSSLVERAQSAGRKPAENILQFLWESARATKDEGLAAKTMEQLIVLYPKRVYWQNAMASALEKLNDDRLKLMTFRLANTVGILDKGAQFREMAQIALDQGNPGEAQAIMEQAFAKNLFTDPREKDSNQRLLEAARKKATQDRASITADEKDAANAPTGDAYVQAGAAYLGFGMVDKAVSAINAGVAKGSLKYPDESYLMLGIAQEKAKNNADAIKAFEKVNKDPRYARLAKLWILEVRS